MRIETMLFCGNPTRYLLLHLEFNELHISFHNLRKIFRELSYCSHHNTELHDCCMKLRIYSGGFVVGLNILHMQQKCSILLKNKVKKGESIIASSSSLMAILENGREGKKVYLLIFFQHGRGNRRRVIAYYWGGVEVALTFSNFTKFHHSHQHCHTTVGIAY